MKQSDYFQKSIPDDIAIKIASSLQVVDLCSLGSCSRFWRELSKSEFLWESLVKQRWPSLGLLEASSFSSSSSSSSSSINVSSWRAFYIERHDLIASRAIKAVSFVGQSSVIDSIEVGDYLKAIEDLYASELGFEDVEILLFNPKLSSLLNLVGLHYCISWLKVPGEIVKEALQRRNISDRKIWVKWWKLGRWFYGFRLRDESLSRQVTLAGLAAAEDEEVLGVLCRGAVHEVLRVHISAAETSVNSWYNASAQVQD